MIKKIRGIKIELIIISIALFVLGLFLQYFLRYHRLSYAGQ